MQREAISEMHKIDLFGFFFLVYFLVFLQEIPDTTYQFFCNQLKLKDQYTEKDVCKKMLDDKSEVNLDR